jgi:FOG: FHA domain
MTLELRVLSGSRAGARVTCDDGVVSVGRHAMSDLRFDPQSELDVSTRHAEFHSANGGWSVVDQGSTNGTFVNGERIAGARRLANGDIVSFGANGPRVEVHGIANSAPQAPPPTAFRSSPSAGAASVPPRLDTTQRVAHQVKQQTKSMRRAYLSGVAVLVVAGGAAFYVWQRGANQREAEMAAVIAHSESTLAALAKKLDQPRPGDSAYTLALRDSLAAGQRDLNAVRGQIAAGTATMGSVSQLSKRMDNTVAMQAAAEQMDLPRLIDRNDPAVAMVASDFDGHVMAGTAFGVSPSGLLVTNRHVVKDSTGIAAGRVGVIFANTKTWLPVHIVRSSDTDDLALLQVDVPGTYPVVAGVSRNGALARTGAPVASIGYPGATDTPMEGTGLKITARTTATRGTVSKRLDDVIQIDSYAGHGSSGSPLFDAAANVVGVVYGGARESAGRIVYAVPAQRLAAFLGADGAGVLR